MLNLDTKPLDNPKVRTLITDITDSGQVFNALSSYMPACTNSTRRCRPQPVDAVVHFAAIPRIMITPDNELFRINALGHLQRHRGGGEARHPQDRHRVERDDLWRLVFANEPRDPAYFPLDEDYDVDPMDSYALSKVVNEKTARAFALRSGIDIYALRIGNVIEPHEYELFPRLVRRSRFPQAHRLELCRRARSRPDHPACNREGRPRLPDLQRGQ